ncbi:segregation and condensation protein A [Guggenheimella bovis]
MAYEIDIEDFRGPFELLFELLEKDKIDIYNIPIHKITNDFLERMEELTLPVEEITSFVVFASMLLEIKSKMLLPDRDLEPIGIDSDDPRRELLVRLLEYKKVREIDYFLSEREKRLRFQVTSDEMIIELPKLIRITGSIPVELLTEAFQRLLEKKRERETENSDALFLHLKREHFSVTSSQKHIQSLLNQSASILFEDLFLVDEPRGKWIANFLALLKLQQEGILTLRQDAPFKKLIIEGKNHA